MTSPEDTTRQNFNQSLELPEIPVLTDPEHGVLEHIQEGLSEMAIMDMIVNPLDSDDSIYKGLTPQQLEFELRRMRSSPPFPRRRRP